MLPDEIEKTLRNLGDDGDKIRGALERDFAAYAKEAEKNRGVGGLARAAARPLVIRGAKAAAEWFFRTDGAGFEARLAEVRGRVQDEAAKRRDRSVGSVGATAKGDAEAEVTGT
jgi:hypothetical protein